MSQVSKTLFGQLGALPADPILGLSTAFAAETNPNKIDLGVGIYRDEAGRTPVMAAVLEAEKRLLHSESSKAYMVPAGDEAFNSGIRDLLLGKDHAVLSQARVNSIQTPGGCGALRIGAELIKRGNSASRVWVSDPTWANHLLLLGSAGLAIEKYPYYDYEGHRIDFDAMLSALQHVEAGDVVLLHGCCHNPSGVDLNLEQWQKLTELALEKRFTPFIDVAYQGLATGLEEDAAGWRLMSSRVPEMLIAGSCSKNFGLYRERTGVLCVQAESERQAQAAKSQALSITRQSYSMPPSHGALIAGMILGDESLYAQWTSELSEMRRRIVAMREMLVEHLGDGRGDRNFDFIRSEFGMFSFLGIGPELVVRLREEFGIYMVDSTRINVAGLNRSNIEYFTESLSALLCQSRYCRLNNSGFI